VHDLDALARDHERRVVVAHGLHVALLVQVRHAFLRVFDSHLAPVDAVVLLRV
jgi:hypothetical protein